MKVDMSRFPVLLAGTAIAILGASPGSLAQQLETLEDILDRAPTTPPGVSLPPLPATPMHFETGEGMDIQVTVVARGLDHPWSLVQLPDGTLLVTERNSGQLRVIRQDVLDPEPVPGMPEVRAVSYSGLHDVILHPDFGNNHLLYLTYNKPVGDGAAMTLMRGRWDEGELRDAEDLFIAEGVGGASRILFDGEGYLFMSLYGGSEDAQDLGQLRGKTIRLTDVGEVPDDNPFAGVEGARPEVWTYGHRTPQGLALNPLTGEVWEMEMGPNGGDEINVLKPGANYGWPYISLGRDYSGRWQGDLQGEGYEDPVVYWMPSISVSGMTFYTGDRLPAWRGDIFVGGLRMGEIPGTGQIQRIRLNARGEEIRREVLLDDLRYRMRGVYQGADGLLYVLLDDDDGAVLRIGPAP